VHRLVFGAVAAVRTVSGSSEGGGGGAAPKRVVAALEASRLLPGYGTNSGRNVHLSIDP